MSSKLAKKLTGPVSFARYGDRHKFPPPGLFDGKTGAMGAFVLNPDTPGDRRLSSKGLDTLAEGDLVRLVLPGVVFFFAVSFGILVHFKPWPRPGLAMDLPLYDMPGFSRVIGTIS